ncbi:para-aminobenzoate synthase [Heliocybe sulcata]|uniref:aminodeoxychorismate synthase n=1 Tax=Heliocybe sulcata TaxID=5364 RepID=A0A5C3NHD4_9AGAM|nr:para-aminobenzoate synthase [Heliocybe sulcata]
MSTYNNPRILLIDSYDSFSYNLAALCRKSIPNCTVHIIKNDQFAWNDLLPKLHYFSAVIVGPGPGSPLLERDIGSVRCMWHLEDSSLLPVFGVCLGLQSLAVEYGAILKRLHVVKHGQISRIQHEGAEIFKGLGEIDAVRYHSLHVELRPEGDVEALAWADDGDDENGRVVMGIKHKVKPFWAVQYHPESVMTGAGGTEVLSNFWRLAKNWLISHDRTSQDWDFHADKFFGLPWPRPRPSVVACPAPGRVHTATLWLPHATLPDICEMLGVQDERSPFVLLDSAAQPGRFSIIGCLHTSTPRITYFLGDTYVSVTQGKHTSRLELLGHDIWTWLASFMRERKAQGGRKELPFWGGLIGYLSYELGVDSLDVPLRDDREQARHPDANLVFVDRSVIVDSATGNMFVQSLLPEDYTWMTSTIRTLKGHRRDSANSSKPSQPLSAVEVTIPDRNLYTTRINQAKEYLRSGDSYELCLTAQTKVKVQTSQGSSSRGSSSWELYKSLRANNPAPYAAYLRLHPSTLVCSSPERFLSFSRPPRSVYQLRPIKGTLRKGPGITRAVAERALRGSTKEVAENLMIVDLIRHDLHGVVGDDVDVPQFCVVEEYETVWQLVSVIEGSSSNVELDEGELGWEALKRSMPPGSMTGAPKKRSVEILQSLEDNERSIYSGVCGYWCVSGAGDWSVVIRSCFKYDDSSDPSSTEEWTIGAGGAITDLSDPEGEWDEMVLKLQSTLGAFNIKTR